MVDLTRAARALGVLGLSRPVSGALLPPRSYGNSVWDVWGARFSSAGAGSAKSSGILKNAGSSAAQLTSGLKSSGVGAGSAEVAKTAESAGNAASEPARGQSAPSRAAGVPRAKTVVTIVDPLHATKKDVVLEPPETLLRNYRICFPGPEDPLISARLGESAPSLFGCVRKMLDQIAARRRARLERYNARVSELQAAADARRREGVQNGAERSEKLKTTENGAEKSERPGIVTEGENGAELRARVVSALKQQRCLVSQAPAPVPRASSALVLRAPLARPGLPRVGSCTTLLRVRAASTGRERRGSLNVE